MPADGVDPETFTPGRLYLPHAAKAFVLAGNAKFTLVSEATGARFTYRTRKADGSPMWFVNVLTAPSLYTYMGVIGETTPLRHTQKSKINAKAASAVAFKWFWGHMILRAELPPKLQFWHEGKCGRCNRSLTDPVSIARGLGPTCAEFSIAE